MNIDKAKPILFSTPMVQAILAERKTQTRRAINHLPHCPVHGIDPYFTSGVLLCKGCDHFPIDPKYKPGDILWVREIWATEKFESYSKTGTTTDYFYKADDGACDDQYLPVNVKWRRAIHMPREAARIFLRVTDVRAERLQDISEEDAQAEYDEKLPSWAECGTYRRGFETLWDFLYAKRGYGWDANPWIWVYTFERVVEE